MRVEKTNEIFAQPNAHVCALQRLVDQDTGSESFIVAEEALNEEESLCLRSERNSSVRL